MIVIIVSVFSTTIKTIIIAAIAIVIITFIFITFVISFNIIQSPLSTFSSPPF